MSVSVSIQLRFNVQRDQDVDVKDVAKELRKELKENFPETKFSVRIRRWALGEAIWVRLKNIPFKERLYADFNSMFNKQIRRYRSGPVPPHMFNRD